MNKKAFRTISFLLSSALFSFFVLQGLWIRNSYQVTEHEIKRAVQEALNETAKKIRLRSAITELKNQFVYENESKDDGGKSRTRIAISSGHGQSVISSIRTDTNIILKSIPSIAIPIPPKVPAIKENRIFISDTVIKLGKGGTQAISVIRNTQSDSSTQVEVKELMGKMMMEIKTIDASPLDSMKADTLRKIIAMQLKLQGIETPFKFAVSGGKGNDKFLLRSADFGKEDAGKAYSTLIFPDNIIKNPQQLYLSIDSGTTLVFSKLKSLLWLSTVLAIFILSIFILALKMIQKQKRMSDIRNDFINNMTHELKTPIATISVAADALKNPKVKAEGEKIDYYTSVIKEENNKMNRNVERVLQLALTDKHDFAPELQVTDFHQLIRQSLSNFTLLFQSRSIEVKQQLNAQNFQVAADVFHLENAINNLIDNAVKYSKENPKIILSTENTKSAVVLHIEDNGIGMNEALQKKIFDKFYRAQSGNIHEVKGFGIGLSYAANVLKAHKGKLSVRSTEGKGSVFSIELPLSL